jgi:hypothetical protein
MDEMNTAKRELYRKVGESNRNIRLADKELYKNNYNMYFYYKINL